MFNGITWLDVISFIITLINIYITYRVDKRQEAYLKDIRKREKEIEDKLCEGKDNDRK